MMQERVAGLTKFRETGVFDNETVPAGLLNDHRLKEGVVGKLIVREGLIKFIVTEPGKEGAVELTEGSEHIIEPLVTHKVEIKEGSSFYIEFYK